MEEMFVCSVCGQSHPLRERTDMDDQEICERCLSEETLVCHICGERIWQDDNQGDGNTPLCQCCYDRYYTNCVRCGALLPIEDACYAVDDPDQEEPLCHSCHSRFVNGGGIQSYYYKPEPIFYGTGARYMGVEVEIDCGGELPENAEELMCIANQNEPHLYCKHDGSLDDGFELVTHPMTLEYHKTLMPWPDVLNRAIELGYSSHKAQTCGLHVHEPQRFRGHRTAAGRLYRPYSLPL